MASATGVSEASSTGTVTVTGAIVQAPASISISNNSIAFGNIDSKGTLQSPQQAIGYLGDGGAYWVTVSAISITVSSPSPWSGTVCRNSATGLPSGGLKLMSPDERPSGEADAANQFDNVSINPSTNCESATIWISNGQPSDTGPYLEHLATFVLNGDLPRSFSAELTFSVSNL
jgi:hypothetical protein